MSKGSPIIPIRIHQSDLDRIEAAVRSSNQRRREPPYNRSSWIIAAITEKLDHIARGRKLRIRLTCPTCDRTLDTEPDSKCNHCFPALPPCNPTSSSL